MDNGNNQTNYQSNYMICPNCKQYVPYGSAFCNYCGFKFQYRQQPKYQQNANQQIPTRKPSGCFTWFVSAFIFAIIWLVLSSAIKNRKEEISEDQVDESTAVYTESEEVTETTTEENEIIIKEQTIYEQDGVKIKVTGYEDNSVCFHIENESDMNLQFYMHSFAINGIMTNNNPFEMDCQVSAHSKNNCKLEIKDEYLKYCGDDIRNFDFHLWAYDVDTNMKDFDCGSIHVLTQKNNGKNDVIKGTTLLEDNGLRFDLIYISNNTCTIAVKNKNDIMYEFDTKNVVVNGWSYDTTYVFDVNSLQVLPNCQNVYTIEFDDEFLKENGITSLDEISLNYSIRPNNDYFEEYNTEKIIITR